MADRDFPRREREESRDRYIDRHRNEGASPYFGARGFPDWDRNGSFRDRERPDVGYADDWRSVGQGFGRSDEGYAQSEYRYRDRGSDRRRADDDGREKRGFMDRASDEVASWFGDENAEQRRMMDQHRGKGPKGYVRSDARILEDINDRLMQDPYLDASEIEALVASAEVTLSGTVASRQDKRRAEDIADSVSGVIHVQNNIRVQAGTIANMVS